MLSKSVSRGEAEMQTGTRQGTRPGKSSFAFSIASERVVSSLTSTSFSSLLMVTYFSLPPFSFTRPSTTLKKLGLIGLDEVTGDSSKLGIFSNLVWRPCANWLAVDIDIRLLPQVQPDDWAVLGVDRAGHLLEDDLDAIKGGLAAGVDLVAWDPVEVGTTWEGIRQLLHLVELVGHGRGLPYFRVVRHPGEPKSDSH